jgi:hypothetical protein
MDLTCASHKKTTKTNKRKKRIERHRFYLLSNVGVLAIDQGERKSFVFQHGQKKKKKKGKETCTQTMLAVVPVSNNTHSYFWEKVQKCWKIHKGPSIHLFFLLFFPSLNLQVCGAGRGPGSSEASVCTFSLSLSHFLFVVFSFSLSLSLLPRRKRNSSFSLIEPVVLNDGRPLFRHTHR